LKLLVVDDHEADDDELYEAHLAGNYLGCLSCAAAFVARALLEGRELPPAPRLEEYVAASAADRAESPPRHDLLALLNIVPGNVKHTDACGSRQNRACTCGAGRLREFVIKRKKTYGVPLPAHVRHALDAQEA
jgi:hypothetical protein